MSENNSIFLLASECQCSDINHEGVNGVNKGLQLEEGESLCKNVLRQKPCVGEGGERERALDDVIEIKVTVRSCCERRNFAKVNQILPTVTKVFENKFGQVEEKPSHLILCLLGFVKATKIRDSSEYSEYVPNVLAKTCLPCQILYRQTIFFLISEIVTWIK